LETHDHSLHEENKTPFSSDMNRLISLALVVE